MTNITTETVKALSYCDEKFVSNMIILTIFFIIVFIASVVVVSNYDDIGYSGIVLSSCWFIVVSLWVISFFISLNVTKTTEVQKTEISVVQVEGKLDNPSGLTVLLKDNHNFYSKKTIKFDGNIQIQEQGSSYNYIEVKTKITYSTKHKIKAWFKEIPKNHSNVKRTLIIPKGSLVQNK